MNYRSTRSDRHCATSAAAVLRGLAPDGGLFVASLQPFDWQSVLKLDTYGMAETILSHLLPDVQTMPELVEKAYRGKFETDELTPLVSVGDRYVLELFRGPTCLCIADNDEVGLRLQAELPKVLPAWKVLSLKLDTEGAKPVA